MGAKANQPSNQPIHQPTKEQTNTPPLHLEQDPLRSLVCLENSSRDAGKYFMHYPVCNYPLVYALQYKKKKQNKTIYSVMKA